MPSGAKPGERRGGRGKGTPNKNSVRRERIAAAAEAAGVTPQQAETVVHRAAVGANLAKEEINGVLVPLVKGVIAHIQKGLLHVDKSGKPKLGEDGLPQIKPGADLGEYREWAIFLADLYKCQMPYELPKFGVFQVGVVPAELMSRMLGRGAPTPALPPPEPDNVTTIDDGEAAMRVYLRVVKGEAA